MIFSDLYGTQLDIELGTADRTQLFTTVRRKKAVNDAMHNFERVTGCTGVYGSIAIVDGTAEYDLFDAFTNYISLQDQKEPYIKRVDASANVSYIQGENFSRRTVSELDRENPGWRADPKGTPSFWYFRDDAGTTWLGVDPPPNPAANSETWTLYVPYLAASTDMVADGDTPFTVNGKAFTILAPYHQALVHYAAGLLEPARKAYTSASRQMQLYAGYVAQHETKKRKDGPSGVTFKRQYLRDAGRPNRPVDPRRFP